MSGNIRWNLYAPIRDVKESGLIRKSIALVDASFAVGHNDRSGKLGSGNQTFATAILGFDRTTKITDAGDGSASNIARWPFEPDNWMLRMNSGFDNVWAVRLIVDKSNKAQDKKNRSTHWIDQQDQQKYATSADLFWIVSRGVDTDYGVNGAGYFRAGGGSRDALALSTSENEGFISDGDSVGQLQHVFTFVDIDAEPTPGGGNTGTPTGGQPNTRPPVLTPEPGTGAFNNTAGSETEIPITGAGADQIPIVNGQSTLQPGNGQVNGGGQGQTGTGNASPAPAAGGAGATTKPIDPNQIDTGQQILYLGIGASATAQGFGGQGVGIGGQLGFTFSGVRTNFSGFGFAQFIGVRTNFTGGQPGASFTPQSP